MAKAKRKKDKPRRDSIADLENKTKLSAKDSDRQDRALPIPDKLSVPFYEKELKKLHVELVRLQEWIRHEKLRAVSSAAMESTRNSLVRVPSLRAC